MDSDKREFGWRQAVNWAVLIVGLLLTGACGFVGMSVASHVYADHLMIDQAREAQAQQLRQAAEQVQKFQQQQQQAAPAAK